MAWKEINLQEYVRQIKEKLKIINQDDIIEKDLLLTLILAEFEKRQLGKYLIFKG